jgi:hypothetical protein
VRWILIWLLRQDSNLQPSPRGVELLIVQNYIEQRRVDLQTAVDSDLLPKHL